MKVLVTGGSGFIGANLCKRLIDAEMEVYCLDNFYSSSKENISELIENDLFHLIEDDVVKLNNIPENIDFDQIYHLACPASPIKYQEDHIYTLRTNFEGTLNLLKFAQDQSGRSGKSPKFLFSSTSEVYGDPIQHPQVEGYWGNVNPNGERSCYDEGKRVAESLCMNYHQNMGVPVKIVRVFNTYGPKMSEDDGRVVSNFIVQALKGENLTVYGDGKQTRSFQYVDDLIDGMMRYMDLDENYPGPINLGNPHETSILKFAEKILQLVGGDLKIEFSKLPADDPKVRCPDITLAKEKLDFSPKVSLDEGLKKTIEYFKGRFA